jgi:glycosyltransferase involved in cell wall biosynthesis
MKPTLTAIIIAKNEESMIANCLESLRWVDQLLVMDNGSSDKTAEIASSYGAQVIAIKTDSFAKLRTTAQKHVKTDWLFFIDADERVTPQLAQEILVHLETGEASALSIPRQNILYGQVMTKGGWGGEYVTRVFQKTKLEGWSGDIHESPIFEGSVAQLHMPLWHLTHRNTVDGLLKTASWTPIEARLFVEAGVAPVTVTTILRKGIMEFLRRGVFKKGGSEGMAGWIEAIIQGINRMIVYILIWEQQQLPSLEEKYQAKEEELVALWKHAQVVKAIDPKIDSKTV